MIKAKFPCDKCKRNFRVLTDENLCAYCYKDKTGDWSLKFVGAKEKKKIIRKVKK